MRLSAALSILWSMNNCVFANSAKHVIPDPSDALHVVCLHEILTKSSSRAMTAYLLPPWWSCNLDIGPITDNKTDNWSFLIFALNLIFFFAVAEMCVLLRYGCVFGLFAASVQTATTTTTSEVFLFWICTDVFVFVCVCVFCCVWWYQEGRNTMMQSVLLSVWLWLSFVVLNKSSSRRRFSLSP